MGDGSDESIIVKNKGQWKKMSIEDVPNPQPKQGEVLVHTVGLNPVDYKNCNSRTSAMVLKTLLFHFSIYGHIFILYLH